ncbi:AT-rich interactive domain-containing protein 4A-like isoform X2 [Euwallacea fornicatus]|uniref:AT-rich interactive domain-containing protein 4A-like isoform X2 n=1 Tax=Euwallacea fornicatus TaxID=995702 RepID=UPI00338EBC76
MSRKNVKDHETPFEELSGKMSSEDSNTSSKSEYKRLKYIEDNVLAALCGQRKCKCCNSVKSIISEIVSFNLLKMTQNDSGFSPQSTDSWKINIEAPSCSPDGSDLDVYMPGIKILSNVTIHKPKGSNKTGNNRAKITHLKDGQNAVESGGSAFQSGADLHKEREVTNQEKKVSVEKRVKRKSHYIVPGSKPRKRKVKGSVSPLKEAKIPSCSPDISEQNVYLVTLDRPERFRETSLKNYNNARGTININDNQHVPDSDYNELPSEADHISKENEVEEDNKKLATKKRRKRKSPYVVPGGKPRKTKNKQSTSPPKKARIPSCSPDISTENIYLATLDPPERFEENSFKNDDNARETGNEHDNHLDAESSSNELLSEDDQIGKESEVVKEANKRVTVKKRRKRKSHYVVPGSKPRKPNVKQSASPPKAATMSSWSSDNSAQNTYLSTSDTSERFKEESLKNDDDAREIVNINDRQHVADSDDNELLSEADHISEENEVVEKDNKKLPAKKRRKRKSHYVVPGSKPYRPKTNKGTFPLKSANERSTAEQRYVEDHSVSPAVDQNVENLTGKRKVGSKGKKRKSDGNSTEQLTKKRRRSLNESGREVDASSTPLKFYKRETKQKSCNDNKGTGELKHTFVPQKLVFSPECWEEVNEGNTKRKMSKSKRGSEGAIKHDKTSPVGKIQQVYPKRNKPLRRADFLNEGGERAAGTEVFYRSKKSQANHNARSYIYALIDNKKFKISHDRAKNGTFSKAVLKRLSRKGGYGLTLGASFLERESLRLQPMKNHKNIYSPERWLTSKLFDDMCLYD